MALSLSIEIEQNSQSVANNTSNVTVAVKIAWTGGSWDWNGYTKYVTINGTKYSFSSAKVNPNNTTTGSQTLYSKTLDISHNSDGSGSVSCYASVKTATSSGTVTASKSKTLTTIPRTSKISISASSVNMGSAITIYSNRKSTSFTHKLYYSIGNGWQSIATGITDSYAWTVPLSLASSIPSATSRSVSLLLETYSGSTFIGSTSTSFTANIPSSVVPSVSGISVVDNNGYASTFGGYVQGKSAPKITVNASASYSSISQYKVSFQGNSYISSSNAITLGAISQTGSLNITVTVTDARGRTASKTVSITGLAYSSPSLSVSAIRCNSDGTANDEGAYMKVSCLANIASINSKNSKSVVLKYKKKTASDWTTQKTWEVYSVNESIIIPASTDSTFNILLTASDSFTTDPMPSASATLETVEVIMDFNKSGKGMAIGKVSEKAGFEVGWNSYFYEPVIIERNSNPWLGLKIGDKIAYIQVSNDKIGIGYNWDKSVKIDPNGNLTGKYLTGTWLQTTAVTDLGSKPPKVAVLNGNGCVYSRTPSELREDLGISNLFVRTEESIAISVSPNTTMASNTVTFYKEGYLPLIVAGYSFGGDWIAYANLIRLNLVGTTVGQANVSYRIRNMSTANTISGNLYVQILWIKV